MGRPKGRRTLRKKKSRSLWPWCLSFILLVIFGVGIAIWWRGGNYIYLKDSTVEEFPQLPTSPPREEPAIPSLPPVMKEEKTPADEVRDGTITPAKKDHPVVQPGGPLIAIVIDDLGYNLQLAQTLFSLQIPLTVSVLPYHPYSSVIAKEAQKRSVEVILHLPMEPHQADPRYLEKNTLLTRMSDDQILNILEADLLSLPRVVGVNNHMGSLMLEDERSMRLILGKLKTKGLYFLDSRTTPKSVGFRIAQELEVPCAVRHVFLDHQNDPAFIEGQIDLLIKKAQKNQKAIAIGHLRPETIEALRKARSKFKREGLTLVTLSELLK